MPLRIPIAYLVESEGEDGKPTLSGKLGKALLVGRVHGFTDDDQRIWAMAIEEPDKRASKRREYYRERREQGDA